MIEMIVLVSQRGLYLDHEYKETKIPYLFGGKEFIDNEILKEILKTGQYRPERIKLINIKRDIFIQK